MRSSGRDICCRYNQRFSNCSEFLFSEELFQAPLQPLIFPFALEQRPYHMFCIFPIEDPCFVLLVPVSDLSSISSACFCCCDDRSRTRSDPQPDLRVRRRVKIFLHLCDHFRCEGPSCASSFDRDYLVHHRLFFLPGRWSGRQSTHTRLFCILRPRTTRAIPLFGLIFRLSLRDLPWESKPLGRDSGHLRGDASRRIRYPDRARSFGCGQSPVPSLIVGAGARRLGLRHSRGMVPSVA